MHLLPIEILCFLECFFSIIYIFNYFLLINIYIKNKQLNNHLLAFIFLIIKIRIPIIIIIAFKPNLLFYFIFLMECTVIKPKFLRLGIFLINCSDRYNI